jgi:predicted TIM-barrel fold metal-dependent hydrolase
MRSPIAAGRDGHEPAALAAAGGTALLSRRHLLLGLTAFAASPLVIGAEARDNPSAIIDVHAHFQPETLRQLGMPGPMASWTVQKHLDDMAAAGVTRSLLSITTPGVPETGERARTLARRINEDAARLAADHPGKLGFFLALPMDDPDSALKEIEYGYDVLKAPGVGLYTSYGKAWLGDARFDPVFQELNRRKAVVYVHPNTADCCTNLLPGIADTLIEYGTDTTRAITNYIYRGAARRFPDVRMIWSHSGGTMPFLMERFEGADRNPATRSQAPDGYRAAASRFFYDIAQSTHAIPSRALKSLVPVDHIVFGSDYPFRTTAEHVQGLQAAGVYTADERAGIYAGNVRRHLPELLGRAA